MPTFDNSTGTPFNVVYSWNNQIFELQAELPETPTDQMVKGKTYD